MSEELNGGAGDQGTPGDTGKAAEKVIKLGNLELDKDSYSRAEAVDLAHRFKDYSRNHWNTEVKEALRKETEDALKPVIEEQVKKDLEAKYNQDITKLNGDVEVYKTGLESAFGALYNGLSDDLKGIVDSLPLEDGDIIGKIKFMRSDKFSELGKKLGAGVEFGRELSGDGTPPSDDFSTQALKLDGKDRVNYLQQNKDKLAELRTSNYPLYRKIMGLSD